ncbi:MAG: winged helix-turn-helix domain-containing protein [Mangrovibacterium sp.]
MSQILSNVHKVQKYLGKRGEVSVGELRNRLKLGEQDVCLALGWMACENRIYLRKFDDELFVMT